MALLESLSVLGWGWETDLRDRIYPHIRQDSTLGLIPPNVYTDRWRGADWPLWRTEIDLAWLRQRSRVVCSGNSFAQGLLANLINYTIGTGYTYLVAARDEVPDDDPETPGRQIKPWLDGEIKKAQRAWDRFAEANRWNSAEDVGEEDDSPVAMTCEQEAIRRVLRDGEAFLRLFFDDKVPAVRWVEPAQVINSGKLESEGWTFGIQHQIDPYDIQRVLRYHIAYASNERSVLSAESPSGDEVDAREIVHMKGPRTDSGVKRGTPLFAYDVLDGLERAAKLNKGSSINALINSYTAEYWEHEFGTQAQVSSLVSGMSAATRTDPATGQTEYLEQRKPGSIRHGPKGRKWVQGPTVQTEAYQAGVQGDLRAAATGACAPEFLASGNADVGSWASLKEAGTPFVLAAEALQSYFRACFLRVVWKVLRHAAFRGDVDGRALKLMKVQVEAPTITQRNELELAQVDQILIGAGVKSVQTAQMERGLDTEQEAANIQEWQAKFGQGGGPLEEPPDEKPKDEPGGGGPPASPTPRPAVAEALRESEGTCKPGERADLTGCTPRSGKGSGKQGDKTSRPAPADVTARVKGILAGGPPTAAHVAEVGAALSKMTVREIQAVKKELGLKASGRKADLARKVAERALAGRGAAPAAPPSPLPTPKGDPRSKNGQPAGSAGNKILPDHARPKLSSAESDAVELYTGGDFEAVNGGLRSGKPLTGDAARIHQGLQAAFAKAEVFPEPVPVARGMNLPADQVAAFASRMEEAVRDGGLMRLPGHTSTATGGVPKGFEGNVEVRIQATKGLDARPFSVNSAENELILPHNSGFRVDKVERVEGRLVVHMAQVAHG